jgi:hypothetical protein
MRKIDKSQQFSTVYRQWEAGLGDHPIYNSSQGEYYLDIVMDALRCQNGLCAYTEIQLCPAEHLTTDNWENGRYKSKNRHHNGQLDHFDERLKWKDKQQKKGQLVIYEHQDWAWANFFVIDSDTNNRKSDKEVDFILKPDAPHYDPFELLEYSPNTHTYIPHTDLPQPIRERIDKMINILGINFPNIVSKRRKIVEFAVKYPFEAEQEFPTAIEMYKRIVS